MRDESLITKLILFCHFFNSAMTVALVVVLLQCGYTTEAVACQHGVIGKCAYCSDAVYFNHFIETPNLHIDDEQLIQIPH